MCAVATSVVSRQYMHVRRSSRSQRPTCRKPSSVHVDRRELAQRRKLRQRRKRRVVDVLAAHAEATKRRHAREARRNPRLPRFGHSRPQIDSSVLDRLSASKPSSVATVSWARSLRRRGIAAKCRMATSSLNLPSAPSAPGSAGATRCAKPARRDAGDVPEEIELGHAVETGQAGEPVVGEWPIDQQRAPPVSRSASSPPCHVFQHRKVVQQRQTGIGDEPSAAEVVERGLALQRLDGAVAGRRSHEVDALEPIAEPRLATPASVMPRCQVISNVADSADAAGPRVRDR